MIGSLLLLCAAVSAAEPAPAQTGSAPTVTFTAPTVFFTGRPYPVELVVEAAANGSTAAAWWLTPAGFLVNGEPALRREGDALIQLPPGARLELNFDLAPYLTAQGNFELSFAKTAYQGGPIAVQRFQPVPASGEGAVDFLEAPVDSLRDYQVVLQTSRGVMVAEFWPDVAPQHVRNFLALSQSGFYDGTLFHRVIPGFMIQGGDPLTKDPSMAPRWGTGGGPRKLAAEFSDTPHDRGVLSMARSTDPNSASSQFFVMHARYPPLDRSYSAFGKLVSGLEVVDAIVNSPRNAALGDRPDVPQVLEQAVVVRRP